MSNLLAGQFKQYYQVPCLPPEIERALSPTAFRYYAFLCRQLNSCSAVELQYSNAEISKETGIRCHKTIAKARSELAKARLIFGRKVPPGVYEHTMLNQAGDPIPPPKERRGIRRYASVPRPTARISSIETVTPGSASPPPVHPPMAPQSVMFMHCRTHRRTEHWRRGADDYVCEKCHPNPNSVAASSWSQPTATDLGF